MLRAFSIVSDFLRSQASTIKDVARQAGVSLQTVSRVVNQHPSVKPTTRNRVLEAIEDLRYQPNSAARSLVNRRSTTLGLISYGTTFYGPASMTESLEQAARSRGYALSLTHLGDLSMTQITEAVQTLRRQQVDGLMLLAPLVGIELNHLKALCQGLPTVLLEVQELLAQDSIAITAMDQYSGAREAANHLIELGHKQLVLLRGPPNWAATDQRAKGWLSALRDAKLQPVANLEGDWSARSGHEAVTRLLQSKTPFTGLLAANDQMALGALLALHEAGIRVPSDVSVVGFDNVPESAYFIPPLTTVYQDFATLGHRSLEQLLEMIEMPDSASRLQVVATQFVVRQSTARAIPR